MKVDRQKMFSKLMQIATQITKDSMDTSDMLRVKKHLKLDDDRYNDLVILIPIRMREFYKRMHDGELNGYYSRASREEEQKFFQDQLPYLALEVLQKNTCRFHQEWIDSIRALITSRKKRISNGCCN